ncbi:replication-relaxation family protein [Streptomyces sp. NPDC005012]|uniref:replication-relaxation family protein n=1 Tax=Streptomyces sp. NPDC005012 TaxID=3154558 RepID=UPI0033A8A222
MRPTRNASTQALLLPHQQGTDHVRRALCNLLVAPWSAGPTATGTAPPPDSPKPPPPVSSRRRSATGKRIASSKTGLREHGLARVDTVIAFHQAQMADPARWRVEATHPTPAGNLLPDAVALLADGSSAFVEIDRTMSYAGLLAKLERYDTYRGAPPSRRGNAARPSRSHWQEANAGPYLN